MPTPPDGDEGRRQERIMLYGDSDAGKTWQTLKVAQWHQRLKSSARFYGICSQGNEWDVMLSQGAEFDDLDNVTWRSVSGIQSWFDHYDRFRKQASENDWIVLDVIGDAWDDVQAEYAEREWGTDLGSKWATTGGGYPIGGADWPWGSINSRYKELAKRRLLSWPGHVVALAWEKDLPDRDDKDSRQARRLFAPVGAMPVGQKDDYKRFHTILHLSLNNRGEHVWCTVRDRQRPYIGERKTRGKAVQVVREPAGDLFNDYLIKVAGWKRR